MKKVTPAGNDGTGTCNGSKGTEDTRVSICTTLADDPHEYVKRTPENDER
jgi:hypothetical protein